MKLESMVELVKIQETLEKAEEVNKILTGKDEVFSYREGGIFGTLSLIEEVIKRECDQDLVNTEGDFEEREYINILNSKEFTSEEKAVKLMGL